MSLSRNSLVLLKKTYCKAAATAAAEATPAAPKPESSTVKKNTAKQKTIQVSILGADTVTGKACTLLLKQNALVSNLYLQGSQKVECMGLDLAHFDTSCKARTFFGKNSVQKAITSADVILMMGLDNPSKPETIPKRIMSEAPRVTELAQICSKHAPKAILVVCAYPVSVMMPLVSEVYRTTHWYHPGRILGSCALSQLKANTLMGRYLNLDPKIVNVPIVGGPDLCCSLPLFSQASPVGVTGPDAENLMEQFNTDKATESVSPAFGINRLVTNMALGICGENDGLVTVFIRSNIINTCRYIVATVKMSRKGVIHNYGLPILAKSEMKLFEKYSLIIRDREKMAIDYLTCPKKSKYPAFLLKEMEDDRLMRKGVIK